MIHEAPRDHVTPAWFASRLHNRSFGMVMLLLGLIAMLPGVSIFAAVLLVVLGYQMTMAHDALVLPRFIARRSLATRRIAGFLNRLIPLIRALERIIRPRWQTPITATKRVVGFIIVILAITLFIPIPLSNVIPGGVSLLIAVAYLEEDGVLLCIALIAALGSITITAGEVWATLRGADFLLRL
jgi:hypothetical protein